MNICLRILCAFGEQSVCVSVGKKYFFKEVSVDKMTNGTMSVGDIASVVQNQYLCSKFFLISWCLISQISKLHRIEHRNPQRRCIPLSFLKINLYIIVRDKPITYIFIWVQKKPYGRIHCPNKVAPSHLYIAKMPQKLPKNQNTSATVDMR